MPPKDVKVRATRSRQTFSSNSDHRSVLLQKTKAKRAPEFRTDDADLQPFSVKVRCGVHGSIEATPNDSHTLQAGQLVRNALGCTGTVLGAKAAAPGGPMCLWVRYESGLQAPIDVAG